MSNQKGFSVIAIILIVIGILIAGVGGYWYYQKPKIQVEEKPVEEKPVVTPESELWPVKTKLVNGFVNLKETKCKNNIYVVSVYQDPEGTVTVGLDGKFNNLIVSNEAAQLIFVTEGLPIEEPTEGIEENVKLCFTSISLPEMDSIVFDAESQAILALFQISPGMSDLEGVKNQIKAIKQESCFQDVLQFMKSNLPIMYLDEINQKEEFLNLTVQCAEQIRQ